MGYLGDSFLVGDILIDCQDAAPSNVLLCIKLGFQVFLYDSQFIPLT